MKRKSLKQKGLRRVLCLLILIFGCLILVKTITFGGDKIAEYIYDDICLCHFSDSNESINQHFFPTRNWNVDYYSPNAQSVYAVYVEKGKNPKVLFSESYEKKLPIASITKLMTALVVLENNNLKNEIIITENAFEKDAFRPDNLNVGERYIIGDLLYPLLLESSNTTAYALAENKKELSLVPYFEESNEVSLFVSKMNQKAKEIGMKNTSFFNPSGLDPLEYQKINASTGKDIATLLIFLLEEKPELWEILSLSNYDLRTSDGTFKKKIVNTNELLEEIPEIIGGKTGRTIRAGDCLALVTKKSEGYIITIILGTQYRFEETKKLLEWINKAYYWEI